MGRWFRFYDDAMHDAKLLRLSDATFRAWVTLLCFASKNSGVLPAAADIAVELRCKPALVASWITELSAAGLIDKTSDGFVPHNWGERQYKSDSSAERMKRHRDRKRDVTSDVTVTAQNRTETDTEQKDAEAKASGADAPDDPSIAEREFFQRGRQILGKSAGGQLAKLKAAKGHNVALARAAIETAATKDKPAEYIAAVIRGPPVARAATVHQQRQAEGKAVLDELHEFNTRTGGRENPGILRQHPGDGAEGVRGGTGGNLIELSAGRDRPRG